MSMCQKIHTQTAMGHSNKTWHFFGIFLYHTPYNHLLCDIFWITVYGYIKTLLNCEINKKGSAFWSFIFLINMTFFHMQ